MRNFDIEFVEPDEVLVDRKIIGLRASNKGRVRIIESDSHTAVARSMAKVFYEFIKLRANAWLARRKTLEMRRINEE